MVTSFKRMIECVLKALLLVSSKVLPVFHVLHLL